MPQVTVIWSKHFILVLHAIEIFQPYYDQQISSVNMK